MLFQGDTRHDTYVFGCHVRLKNIQNNIQKKKKNLGSWVGGTCPPHFGLWGGPSQTGVNLPNQPQVPNFLFFRVCLSEWPNHNTNGLWGWFGYPRDYFVKTLIFSARSKHRQKIFSWKMTYLKIFFDRNYFTLN
jgi:hypothetical protein